MKINKYTPPDRLKAEVMAKIADDGYADELLSLPETSKKRMRIIPLLSAAAAVTVVVCASVYVSGLGGHKNAADESSGTDNEAAIGSTDGFADFDEPEENINGDGGVNNQLSDNSSVSNENGFIPDSENENDGMSKNEPIIATVTVNGNTVSLTPADSYDILKLLEDGEFEPDMCKCSPIYKITIGTRIYYIHENCGDVVTNDGMLHGVEISQINKIVEKYIDIEQ